MSQGVGWVWDSGWGLYWSSLKNQVNENAWLLLHPTLVYATWYSFDIINISFIHQKHPWFVDHDELKELINNWFAKQTWASKYVEAFRAYYQDGNLKAPEFFFYAVTTTSTPNIMIGQKKHTTNPIWWSWCQRSTKCSWSAKNSDQSRMVRSGTQCKCSARGISRATR